MREHESNTKERKGVSRKLTMETGYTLGDETRDSALFLFLMLWFLQSFLGADRNHTVILYHRSVSDTEGIMFLTHSIISRPVWNVYQALGVTIALVSLSSFTTSSLFLTTWVKGNNISRCSNNKDDHLLLSLFVSLPNERHLRCWVGKSERSQCPHMSCMDRKKGNKKTKREPLTKREEDAFAQNSLMDTSCFEREDCNSFLEHLLSLLNPVLVLREDRVNDDRKGQTETSKRQEKRKKKRKEKGCMKRKKRRLNEGGRQRRSKREKIPLLWFSSSWQRLSFWEGIEKKWVPFFLSCLIPLSTQVSPYSLISFYQNQSWSHEVQLEKAILEAQETKQILARIRCKRRKMP